MKKQMKTTSQILSAGLFFIVSSAAMAIAPGDEILQRTAEYRTQEKEEIYLGVVRKISQVFRVSISFEWSYVNVDRSEAEYPTIKFGIAKGETLTAVLDRFCALTEGRLRWATIHGVICIWPTGTAGEMENLLDIRISLKVDRLSTWHAFLELVRAINKKVPADRFLVPRAEPFQDQYIPPWILREDSSISLDLVHVTAREAVCAIMAASPVHAEFRYWTYYRPDLKNAKPIAELALWPYDENHELLSKSAWSLEERMKAHIYHDEIMAVKELPTAFEVPAPGSLSSWELYVEKHGHR